MSSRRPTRIDAPRAVEAGRRGRIVLGVTGSIAAYKAAELASQLRQRGHDVHAVLTKAAQRFVTPLTFKTLTGNAVLADLWSEGEETKAEHIAAIDSADALVVAPATADFIARAAHGFADDALSATLLAAQCPVLVAPAMNHRMWKNAIVQRNVAALRDADIEVIDPEDGWLAEGETGVGRLASLEVLIARIEAALPRRR
jgi:phosphopantothenoylcysteine synthetase/decarboxylase